MHAVNGNGLRREETAEETVGETISAFATNAGYQAKSKSIASLPLTSVY